MISLDQAGRAKGYSQILAPPPSVATWVEHAWITRLPNEITAYPASRGWKVVPDLSPNLLVHRTHRGTSFRLVGPRTRATDIDVRDRVWSVGIRLRPGTLPALTQSDAHELTDSSSDPSRYWGAQDAVREALNHATTAPEALDTLLHFLESLPKSGAPDWRARIVTGAPGQRVPDTVADLVRRHGVSRRTLQTSSLRDLGMSPKTALRIRRLYHVLQAALSGPAVHWSRIAQATGYCDGAHLSREFRTLMTEEPSRWVRRARAP